MDYPWWFALAIIPIAAAMIYIIVRRMLRIKEKVDSGRAEWTDDWDPFEK